MRKRMYADFSDKAYSDLNNGKAMLKNGFRTNRGNFHPEQPVFTPMNERLELIKDTATNIVRQDMESLNSEIIFPMLQKAITQKFFPFIVEKWHNFKRKHITCDEPQKNSPSYTDNDNIINLENRRKNA